MLGQRPGEKALHSSLLCSPPKPPPQLGVMQVPAWPPRQHLASPACVWLQLFHRPVQLIMARANHRLYQKSLWFQYKMSPVVAKKVIGCSKKSTTIYTSQQNTRHLKQKKHFCQLHKKLMSVPAKNVAGCSKRDCICASQQKKTHFDSNKNCCWC